MQELMLKNEPVLQIDGMNITIINYDLLPVGLRYPDVSFDDVFHGWTENRIMHIGRTNAKAIAAAYRVSQSNLYVMGKACHFATLNDCYWIRDYEETIDWSNVSLFSNPLDEEIISTALYGKSQRIELSKKVGYAELGSQGYTAKAWIRESDDIYMYKVARKELPASQLLDQLGFSHVPYIRCTEAELMAHATEEQVQNLGDELLVKSKNIASESISLVSFDDFMVYADRHGFDPFEYLATNYPREYSEMIIADFLLGNSDRHGGNYGFFMDNTTGNLMNPYPLMDHDHVFSAKRDFLCQNTWENISQMEFAIKLISDRIPELSRPDAIRDEEWEEIQSRCEMLNEHTK